MDKKDDKETDASIDKQLSDLQKAELEILADLKTKDYLLANLTNAIDDQVERRIERRFRFWKIFTVAIAVILAPAGWFSVKSLIAENLTLATEQVNKQTAAEEKKLNAKILALQQSTQQQLLYMKISNEALGMHLKSRITQEEINSLMDSLEEASKIPNVQKNPSFASILDKVVYFLVEYGNENYLYKIANWFPEIINENENINQYYIAFYARELLSTTDIANIKESSLYKRFQDHTKLAELHKAEQDSLPMQALVQFRLNGNERNPLSTNLLESTDKLSVEEQAYFLWYLFQTSQPEYWQNNPSPSDFRVSDVSNKFLFDYQTELAAIANRAGVKTSLRGIYRGANTTDEVRLGEDLFQYFFKEQPD